MNYQENDVDRNSRYTTINFLKEKKKDVIRQDLNLHIKSHTEFSLTLRPFSQTSFLRMRGNFEDINAVLEFPNSFKDI